MGAGVWTDTKNFWYFKPCNQHRSVPSPNTSTFRFACLCPNHPMTITRSCKVKMSEQPVGRWCHRQSDPVSKWHSSSRSRDRVAKTGVQFLETLGVRLGLKNRLRRLGIRRPSAPRETYRYYVCSILSELNCQLSFQDGGGTPECGCQTLSACLDIKDTRLGECDWESPHL